MPALRICGWIRGEVGLRDPGRGAGALRVSADATSSSLGSPCLETDGTRMCALLVGLPNIRVVGVGEWPQWVLIVIAIDSERQSCCQREAHRHGVREVMLVDLPVFGRPARLVWR